MADYILTSGREFLSLADRLSLLRTGLVTLHKLEAPVELCTRVGLAAKYLEMNLTSWLPAIAKVECELMAWIRGGRKEWSTILEEQRKATTAALSTNMVR